ncbi:MAG: YgiQ family radical SAM protein [Desulfovibrionaceae bacterium]|nr:YgiQ family radical SAM protein [Desulfovibrionaceae bacterium]
MSRDEMEALGWEELDILLISGDAYVDHPAFGPALLGRWLLAHGFKVGIISQPDWKNNELSPLNVMGRPRLFAGITAGSMDSMLAHYTAFRKKRKDDAYTPGGLAGARPNRACLVYTGMTRQAFPGLPVILGGIEASLRRTSHYDFWSDSLRKSILLDSKADLLVYGMGETSLLTLAVRADSLERKSPAEYLAGKVSLIDECKDVRGIAFVGRPEDIPDQLHSLRLPAHQEILDDPKYLIQATLDLERQVHQACRVAVQETEGRLVLLNPPNPPMSREEMDRLYSLPFARAAHPSYTQPVPALEMLKTSITSHRGCGGGCSFCSLALHQGRLISSRSEESVLQETAEMLKNLPKGRRARQRGLAISDIGGPTVNMWGAVCEFTPESCTRTSCLFPTICPGFKVNQSRHVSMLRRVKSLPGVSQVRIGSGLRYDLGMRDPEALRAYIGEFIGGQLKVAPEHVSDSVLTLMRKPARGLFEVFLNNFVRVTRQSGKEQYVVPYLMSGFPGCNDGDMRALAVWLAERGWRPQQVQCFIPTPGTLATAMYYSRLDPAGNIIYVARTDAERLRQHQILLGKDPLGAARLVRQKKSAAASR